MKINAAGINTNTFKPCFKSIRTDKYTIGQLKTGDKPITDNNKVNIYTALNNLSEQHDRKSIEFLLDAAEHLQYGQGSEDSEFKKALDVEGITPEERENTSWSQILDDTIRCAISSSDEDVSDLETEYEKICAQNKKLTPEQQRILDLRKEFTSVIINDAVLDNIETLSQTARIRKNLDYFTASSEISLKQKQECLEKLLYFMSDDYKINPQLTDKKLQVVDEMLNDMLIKTPEQKELTIKSVNQRQSGICAAISICRKAVAYEDKTRFVEIIMDELADSPVMSVFDVTDLESGKKVDIPKTDINYTRALEKGYRIIDASAHNWMNNAHASGDGSIQTEHYIAFDDENYGIYDDTSWYFDPKESQNSEKIFLRALIKEKEFLKSFNDTKKDMADITKNLSHVKKENFTIQSSAIGKLNTIFEEIFPEKSNSEISAIIKGLLKFYKDKDENNEVHISPKMSLEVKQNILTQYLFEDINNISDEQKEKIKLKSKSIYMMTDAYVDADLKLKKIQKFNSPRSKYIYYKKLFNLAAAHRLAVEADINKPGGTLYYENLLGLPPSDIQSADYMKSLKKHFEPLSVSERQIKNNGENSSSESLSNELNSDLLMLETVIPAELDMILQKLTGENSVSLVTDMLTKIADGIENDDTELFASVKTIMQINYDKKETAGYLRGLSKKLSDSPSRENFLNSIRMLGYENQMQFSYAIMSVFISSLNNEGISEEDLQKLSKRFGGYDKIESGIEAQQARLQELSEMTSCINEKWKIPSLRSNILLSLEKQHYILSRKKLDILKNKFDFISSKLVENEQINNVKERQKTNSKFYKFNDEEIDIFNNIEKMLPFMKKYCQTRYQSINKYLYEDLENRYSEIGMLNGQFWVREEGSTGLSTNEQVRIIEQMTGEPYHIERDVYEAAKQIKEGTNSGIITLSVDDSDYAFHAQYVPSVTSESFINPITNEKIIKEIIWADNSWGRAEREHYWNGHNGFYYTDYNNGYGWNEGFILSPDNKIGLPVDDIAEAIGCEKEDNEEFGLFTNVILPGTPVDTYQKLYKMFGYILDIKNDEKILESLEACINNGEKLNIKQLESLDSIAESREAALVKRVKNEIKSKEDFDKLPDNDELKFLFKKIAVYLSTDDPVFADSILTIKDNNELEAAVNEFVEAQVDEMASVIGKSDITIENLFEYTSPDFEQMFQQLDQDYSVSISDDKKDRILNDIFFDEEAIEKHDGTLKSLESYFANQVVKSAVKNIEDNNALEFFIKNAQRIIQESIDENLKIKSLDDNSLVCFPLYQNLINAIDKYLKPSSDEEMLAFLQGLQMADYETANKFFEVLDEKDAGINIKDPYYYVVQYKTGNSKVTKAFSEIISTQEIYSFLRNNNDEESKEDNPDELYRSLYVKLADMNVQEYIRAFKAEAFQKYKVRQAFPQPVVIKDEDIEDSVIDLLEVFRAQSDNIKNNKYLFQIFSKISNLQSKFSSKSFYVDLLNLSDVKITDENSEFIKEFKTILMDLASEISNDDSLITLNDSLKKLIGEINFSKSEIDGKKAGTDLNEINTIFNQIGFSGIDETRFIQIAKEQLHSINEGVRIIVNANIEPKYRDEAAGKIFKYIDMYRKDVSKDELLFAEDELVDYFVEKHIIKNPVAILKEYIKLLMDGKSSSDECQILRGYLVDALHVAQQTKIQYKLVQNQHEGISSKTRDLLPGFSVIMEDGSKKTMDSEEGMLYLVRQLENEGDNYTILNLFLNQSGLAKYALRALINNFDIEKSKLLLDNEIDKIIKNISDIDKLEALVSDFNSMSKIEYKSIEDAAGYLSDFVKRKEPDYKDIQIFDNFINYLDALDYSQMQNSDNQDMINILINNVGNSALNYCIDNINEQIKYIENLGQMLNERTEMLNSISVPVNSEEYDLRNQFLKTFQDLINYYSGKCDIILNSIQNSEFSNDENAPCG